MTLSGRLLKISVYIALRHALSVSAALGYTSLAASKLLQAQACMKTCYMTPQSLDCSCVI